MAGFGGSPLELARQPYEDYQFRMNRTAIVFVVGVFLPSLILGWLALRTIDEQQIILEQRTAALFQGETDFLAREAAAIMDSLQRQLDDRVQESLASSSPAQLADNFSTLMADLPAGVIPFALAPDGRMVTPAVDQDAPPAVRSFLLENRLFLSSQAQAEVFQAPATALRKAVPAPAPAPDMLYADKAKFADESRERMDRTASASLGLAEAAPAKQSPVSSSLKSYAPTRNVAPQQVKQEADAETPLPASVNPEVADFRSVTATGASGILARFVEDRLQWFFWSRPQAAGGYTFGWMLPAEAIKTELQELLPERLRDNADLCLALLDERGKPVYLSVSGFTANWKRPFVASEIGDVLPFWEAAAYLRNPVSLDQAVEASRLTLFSLIALAIAAILAAGYFVVRDTRRQMRLAAQKTDFVSNVSHELKTPLTSIRMFAELLGARTGEDAAKRQQYSRIITLESERLTRLINNVLDFARMEKRRKTYERRPCDLYPLIERLWEGVLLRLDGQGWSCEWQADPGPYLVLADEDAISQILMNLLSNAEKYGQEGRSLALRSRKENDILKIEVLDRGSGVPRGEERKIFEAFHRAHDSLSAGVQGTGLGLTLASAMAAAHEGTIAYSPREGGGSCFTLTLPLLKESAV